ncbi:hypothetical protein ABL78_5532 [Leptomonas seymouri]|uniref:Transmembrane protein n=1 Tax=Leptomonas seymouri TaxID=5684 RepID=A0A0N0P4Z6_LEPSE|nr:hypothetical protein ABL78_5532 [Leptomonas seymouri]|eukprot:KPI85407.1 hypothetical protein ABL78_5532 [Leptomonas seymouri]
MSQPFPRPSIIVDTAPPPLPTYRPLKPIIVYANKSASTMAHVLNASVEAANVTLRNTTDWVASAANSTAKEMSQKAASAASNAVSKASSSTTAAISTNSTRWYDKVDKMTTASVSEHVSRLSLLHLFAWFFLFTALTTLTVVLLNWGLRSRQSAADAKDEDKDEEMPTKAFALPSSSSTQGTLAEGTGSASSSSNRLLATRGNVARQQFLESRKAGGSIRSYGSTETR